jgi:hypothetical protein
VPGLLHRLATEKARVKHLLEDAATISESETRALVRRHDMDKDRMLQVMAAAKETFVQRLKTAEENSARLKGLLRQRTDEVRELKLRFKGP